MPTPVIQSCSFILFSDLLKMLPDEAARELEDYTSDRSDITFGDANKTLITVERFLKADMGTDENPDPMQPMFDFLAKLPEGIYIDLEN